jgi:hypothetical protein
MHFNRQEARREISGRIRQRRASIAPVWGPIFRYVDNYNDAAVRQRINSLCDFLELI